MDWKLRIKTGWPLLAGLFVYWAAVAILVFLAAGMNGGHFIYPLDDTYIHMAIARNAATAGVWGVTPYEFTSSTSSPVWTALLTASYFLVGVNESAPLVLAVICGTLLIGVTHAFLAKYIQSPCRIFLVLLILIFATPLPTLTVSGMEHVLHILLVTVFFSLAIPLLSAKNKPTLRGAVPILVVALFLVLTRYESLFLAFVVCAIFLFQRKVTLALILGAVSLVPAIVYGMWSMAHGWYFFPNSVLLKGHKPHLSPSLGAILNQFGFGALDVIQANSYILVLVIFSLLWILRHSLRQNGGQSAVLWAHVVFLGCLVLHLQFAATGWFFRYDAYLVFIGLAIAAIAVNELLPQSWVGVLKEKGPFAAGALAVLALVIGIPFYNRALQALQITPQASNNIFEQQYQMARFLHRHYPESAIAANDIGAISYFTDIRLVDLMGLATLEMAKDRLDQSLSPQKIETFTQQRGVSVAIVYDSWFRANDGRSLLPATWVPVAQWRITHNVVCGGDTITIYAASAQGVEQLKESVRKFAPILPKDVLQAGTYGNAPKP